MSSNRELSCRYLGFFQPYNVLILTLKGAAPNILRFIACASLIFTGYRYFPVFSLLTN